MVDPIHGKGDLRLYIEECKSSGIPETEAINLMREAWERKGVLPAMGKNALNFRLEDGIAAPGEEIRNNLPDGLNQIYVNGIYPIGPIEKEI